MPLAWIGTVIPLDFDNIPAEAPVVAMNTDGMDPEKSI
jgi:hypothetical protein